MFRQLQPNTKYYVSVQGYIDDGGKQFVTPSGQSFRRTSKCLLLTDSIAHVKELRFWMASQSGIYQIVRACNSGEELNANVFN